MVVDVNLKTPEWTNFNQSDFGVAILDALATALDILSYNIDTQANESFLDTAVTWRAVQNILHSLGYEMRRITAASATVKFTLNLPYSSNITIPAGTIVGTPDGVKFVTSEDAVITPGALSPQQDVPIYQGALHEETFQMPANITEFDYTLAYQNVPENFLQVRVGGPTGFLWTEEKKAAPFPSSLTTIYRAIEDFDTSLTLHFSQYLGTLPPAASLIDVKYLSVDSPTGGNVGTGTITQIFSGLSLPTGYTCSVTNRVSAGGGLDRETIQEAKVNGPRSFRTLQRAVTLQDFEDLLSAQPGVDSVFCINHAGFVETYLRLTRASDGTFPLLKVEAPVIGTITAGSSGSITTGTDVYVAITIVQYVADPGGGSDLVYESSYTRIDPATGNILQNPAHVVCSAIGNVGSVNVRATNIQTAPDLTRPFKFNVYAGTWPSGAATPSLYLVNTGGPLDSTAVVTADYTITALPPSTNQAAPLVNMTATQNLATGRSYYQDLFDYLEPKRLLCTKFEIYDPVTVTINLAITVIAKSNYRRLDVQDSVTTAVKAYFALLQMGQPVYMDELEAWIFGSVLGARNVTVTSPTTDTITANNAYGVLGTLSINVTDGIA